MTKIDGLNTLPKTMDVGEAALTMAIGIVIERINRLSADDKNDLFDLVKALATAQSAEDVEAVNSGMREILDQHPYAVRALEFPPAEPPVGLAKWNHHLAAKVRELRKRANKTQSRFAEETGLAQSHISRIENAELSPSHRTVEKLAAALGVNPGELDPTR